MDTVQIAKICHQANKAYCEALGDTSQPEWEDAPDWQCKSAINGVLYHLEHPDSKPSDSHVNWLAEKRETGWEYGPVKDPDKKQHPCFVPYDQLPEDQKAKDLLFLSIVRCFG